MAGLWSKNWKGISVMPFHMVNITGQSSMCGTWWKPMVYQVTMSVSWIWRSCATQAGQAVGAVALEGVAAAGVALAAS